MSDERLQHDDDALLGRLLRAGDSDEPSSQTVHKVLLAVTASAGATGAAGAASASGSLLGGGVLKWLGIGILCGLGTSLGAQFLLGGNAKPPPTPGTRAAVPARPAESAGNTPPEARRARQPSSALAPTVLSGRPASGVVATPALPGAKATAAAAPAAEPSPTTLSEELLVLERARSAVARGDQAAANAAIAEYSSRFPHGRLYPELTLVRMDLLEQSGRHAEARSLAKRFLASHPESPSAARLRSRFGLNK